jgi:MFS family permease
MPVNTSAVKNTGFAVLVLADLALGLATNIVGVMIGVVLWGLHMGLTQGLLATLVADTAPAELRGTAYGMFNLVSGLAMLAASIVAGVLWDLAGPMATFLAGACFALIAVAGVVALQTRAKLK